MQAKAKTTEYVKRNFTEEEQKLYAFLIKRYPENILFYEEDGQEVINEDILVTLATLAKVLGPVKVSNKERELAYDIDALINMEPKQDNNKPTDKLLYLLAEQLNFNFTSPGTIESKVKELKDRAPFLTNYYTLVKNRGTLLTMYTIADALNTYVKEQNILERDLTYEIIEEDGRVILDIKELLSQFVDLNNPDIIRDKEGMTRIGLKPDNFLRDIISSVKPAGITYDVIFGFITDMMVNLPTERYLMNQTLDSNGKSSPGYFLDQEVEVNYDTAGGSILNTNQLQQKESKEVKVKLPTGVTKQNHYLDDWRVNNTIINNNDIIKINTKVIANWYARKQGTFKFDYKIPEGALPEGVTIQNPIGLTGYADRADMMRLPKPTNTLPNVLDGWRFIGWNWNLNPLINTDNGTYWNMLVTKQGDTQTLVGLWERMIKTLKPKLEGVYAETLDVLTDNPKITYYVDISSNGELPTDITYDILGKKDTVRLNDEYDWVEESIITSNIDRPHETDILGTAISQKIVMEEIDGVMTEVKYQESDVLNIPFDDTVLSGDRLQPTVVEAIQSIANITSMYPQNNNTVVLSKATVENNDWRRTIVNTIIYKEGKQRIIGSRELAYSTPTAFEEAFEENNPRNAVPMKYKFKVGTVDSSGDEDLEKPNQVILEKTLTGFTPNIIVEDIALASPMLPTDASDITITLRNPNAYLVGVAFAINFRYWGDQDYRLPFIGSASNSINGDAITLEPGQAKTITLNAKLNQPVIGQRGSVWITYIETNVVSLKYGSGTYGIRNPYQAYVPPARVPEYVDKDSAGYTLTNSGGWTNYSIGTPGMPMYLYVKYRTPIIMRPENWDDCYIAKIVLGTGDKKMVLNYQSGVYDVTSVRRNIDITIDTTNAVYGIDFSRMAIYLAGTRDGKKVLQGIPINLYMRRNDSIPTPS